MRFSRLTLPLAALFLAQPALMRAQDDPAPPVNPLIVGGEPVADIADTPWQVALVSGGEDRNQFCGGSLVAPTWVLTAAHCVDNFIVGMDPTRLEVVAGTLEYASGGEQMAVKAIHAHPSWNDGNMDFDAALLELASPAAIGVPIELMAADAELPVGPAVRVSGWGATAEGGPGSNELLFVEVPVVATDECNLPASYNGAITDAMFCAGAREGGIDSCQGDSGGPVDDGAKLVGVVSWGHGCARRLKYGVYTRVSAVSDWAGSLIAE
jgi:secreted trypsin-like serine protease